MLPNSSIISGQFVIIKDRVKSSRSMKGGAS
jgi:hypothetical protein